MSGYIYDQFTTEQNSDTGNPLSSGTWGPPSSRYIDVNSYWSDTGEYLQLGIVGTEFFSGICLTYNYTPNISFSSGAVVLVFFAIPEGDITAEAYPSTSSIAELTINSNSGPSSLYSTSPSAGTLTSGTINFTLEEEYTNVSSISLSFYNLSTSSLTTANLNLSSLGSTVTEIVTCLAAGSKILTNSGYKPIETLQRGEETPQGKIARIVVEELRDYTRVKLAKIGDLLACANHSFLVQGKRVLAKDLPEAELMEGFAKDVLSDNKLYDIQYDFEGTYTVWTGEKELESQSRSPYCKLTPLSKELYWKEENYKDLLVDNTLQEY